MLLFQVFFKLYESLCHLLILLRCIGDGISALDRRLEKIPTELTLLILRNIIVSGRKEGRVNKRVSMGDK